VIFENLSKQKKHLKARPLEERSPFSQEAAMADKGYSHIPNALFDAITFLARALPKRSVPTWLELLFGAMLTQAGFVTEA
jgi:hypothetical protein